MLSGRGAVELWSGHLRRGGPRPRGGRWPPTAASGGEDERADCAGLLALVEALRGRLRRAAELAGQAVLAADERRPPGQNPNPAALVALAWVHLERNELREARSCAQAGRRRPGRKPGQADRGGGLPGRGERCPGGGPRRGGRADHRQGTVRVACSGLARPAAEPGRVASVRGGRRHPGRTGRSRTGRPRDLAGGCGHPRARLGDRRRRRQRTARARTRARSRQRDARPGTRASVAGGRPAQLRQRRPCPRSPVLRGRAAAGRTRTAQTAIRGGAQLDWTGAAA